MLRFSLGPLQCAQKFTELVHQFYIPTDLVCTRSNQKIILGCDSVECHRQKDIVEQLRPSSLISSKRNATLQVHTDACMCVCVGVCVCVCVRARAQLHAITMYVMNCCFRCQHHHLPYFVYCIKKFVHWRHTDPSLPA